MVVRSFLGLCVLAAAGGVALAFVLNAWPDQSQDPASPAAAAMPIATSEPELEAATTTPEPTPEDSLAFAEEDNPLPEEFDEWFFGEESAEQDEFELDSDSELEALWELFLGGWESWFQ
jgi:hypothetical protein